MSTQKVLAEEDKEQFKSEWATLSLSGYMKKYGIGVKTVKRWGKELELPFPKPKITNPTKVISAKEETPTTIVNNTPALNVDQLPTEQVQEVHACKEEFAKINNDDTIPKRQKDEMLCNLSLKIIGIYVHKAPDTRNFVERVVDFFKLKQYEKRVIIAEKDSAEIDLATMKNLKKRHVSEALDDICAELTESERKFFDHLLQTASDRVMERRTKINEDIQKRALEISGVATGAEPPVAQ